MNIGFRITPFDIRCSVVLMTLAQGIAGFFIAMGAGVLLLDKNTVGFWLIGIFLSGLVALIYAKRAILAYARKQGWL